jgi:NitT/TauT family transport system substrate-binding protein
MEAALRGMGAGRRGEIGLDWPRYTYAVTLDQSLIVTLEQQARWALAEAGRSAEDAPDFTTIVDARVMDAVKPDAVGLIR